MAMSFQTNISSLIAQRNLMNTQTDLSRSLARLSSGFRVNNAQDDAAGLAISVNLGAQIRSYNQVVRNANDALNITQTAESSLNETQNILTRLRELATQSASSGISNTERGYIQNEVTALVSEVDRIANATEYNGVSLIN
ncbi:MAG: flagellin, partial [Myxococcales bacterium]|nr:flagellin [Myxococcales bacterium]